MTGSHLQAPVHQIAIHTVIQWLYVIHSAYYTVWDSYELCVNSLNGMNRMKTTVWGGYSLRNIHWVSLSWSSVKRHSLTSHESRLPTLKSIWLSKRGPCLIVAITDEEGERGLVHTRKSRQSSGSSPKSSPKSSLSAHIVSTRWDDGDQTPVPGQQWDIL